MQATGFGGAKQGGVIVYEVVDGRGGRQEGERIGGEGRGVAVETDGNRVHDEGGGR